MMSSTTTAASAGQSQRHRRWAQFAIPLLLCCAWVWGYFTIRQHKAKEQLNTQELNAERLFVTLRQNLQRYEDMLNSLHLVFIGSQEVTRSEFRLAANNICRRYSGIQALEWVPRIPGSQRAAVEQKTRQEGYPRFEFRDRLPSGQFQRSPDRPEHFPILFAEPEPGNEVVLGYDLMSGPTRDAQQTAARDGVVVATPRLTLAQETGGQYGIIILLPVYQSALRPPTEPERLVSLIGFLQGIFRLGDMIDSTWHDTVPPDMDILMLDVTAPGTPQVMHHSTSSGHRLTAITPAEFQRQFPIRFSCVIGKRQWQVGFRPDPTHLARQHTWSPELLLLSGCLFSALLAIYLRTVFRQATRVEQLVAKRTTALVQRREQLRLALTSARMGVWDYRPATDRYTLSDETVKLLGLTPGVFDGQGATFRQLVHPEDRHRLQADLLNVVDQKGRAELEFRVVLPDGTTRWLAGRAQYHHTQENNVTWLAGVVADITEKKAGEQELLLLEAAVRQASDMVVILNPDGTLKYANHAFEKLVGRPSSDIKAAKLDRWLELGQDIADAALLVERVGANGYWNGTVKTRDAAKPRTLEATLSPVTSHAGKALGYLATLRDITREIALEQQLRDSQKMEAVGLLAGGVAHDFNNLLQVIHGYLELAGDESVRPERRREYLAHIQGAAGRASQLTRQLLAFSRKQPLSKTRLDLNQSTLHFLRMIQRIIGENITVKFHSESGLPDILADEAQVEQILMNLCVNARDAMPAGGTLTLRTRSLEIHEDTVLAHPWITPGRFVELRVEDTGQGMEEETRARIFEPFFTTKDKHKGTGLGLAMVYGICQQHGGFIRVESQPGRGTSFLVCLPVSPEPAPARTTEKSANPHLNGRETVLLAEDDPGVRGLALSFLQNAGYKVFAAEDGLEAVALHRQHHGSIDLLVSDLMMPRMSGWEAFVQMRERQSDLPVVFCSGYSETALPPNQPLPGNACLLPKPFTRELLLRSVRNLLDAKPKSGVNGINAASP
jgi:PAS domain S-box-containing protein